MWRVSQLCLLSCRAGRTEAAKAAPAALLPNSLWHSPRVRPAPVPWSGYPCSQGLTAKVYLTVRVNHLDEQMNCPSAAHHLLCPTSAAHTDTCLAIQEGSGCSDFCLRQGRQKQCR